MTDSDHALTPRAGIAGPGERLDPADVDRHLRRLTAAYPSFTFGHEVVNPWRGPRWVAERRDRRAPGTLVVITGDLMELHAALQKDKEASHAAR